MAADQDVRLGRQVMFENLHWSVQAIPIVVVGGVLLTWLLGRHKEKKSSDHIFKL